MRVGFETVSWGSFPPNFAQLVEEAGALGFHGLQIAQRPEQLGLSVDELCCLLDNAGLHLISISAGSVILF